MKRKSLGSYYTSFDLARVICMALIIVQSFTLPIPYFEYARPFLGFATGTLFTIYGYLVLRDGADLTKNIKHALKVFLIMFVIYGAITILTIIYSSKLTGNVTVSNLFTKRNIFNFVVLNYWPTDICSSIWYVQATLYSLIICWLLRKFKKWDWLLCIVLFVIAILTGELSGVINFSVLGYSYIPANFFTRALPYMLLGRLVCEYRYEIDDRLRIHPIILFIIGLALAVIEFFLLLYLGKLNYELHMIGFIIMAASLCYYLVTKPEGRSKKVEKYYPTVFKTMYFMCSPFGYLLLIAVGFFFGEGEGEVYSTMYYFIGLATLIVTGGVGFLIAFLKDKFKSYDKDPELYET